MDSSIRDEFENDNIYIKLFSGKDIKNRGRPNSDDKAVLCMHCNEEMQQYFVEIRSKPLHIRTYYGNLKKNIIYFNKLIQPLAAIDLTNRLEMQRYSPGIPKSFSGKYSKSFRIDNDWYEEISSMAGYLTTSSSNVGLILSYIGLPIEFYAHYPRLISLYEHIEDVLNKYYFIGTVKLNKRRMIRDVFNRIYDNTSDRLKLLHGIIEIYNNNENDNEDFKNDVDIIISLLNKESQTVDDIDCMEHFINKYWMLLTNNNYTKDLKYW